MMKFASALLPVFALFISEAAFADEAVCGPPPPLATDRQEETSSLKAQLEGKAKFLSEHVGKAELTGQIETARRTLYQSIDKTSAARQEAYLAYVFCMIVTKDKTLSAKEKIDAINAFRRPLPDKRGQIRTEIQVAQLGGITEAAHSAKNLSTKHIPTVAMTMTAIFVVFPLGVDYLEFEHIPALQNHCVRATTWVRGNCRVLSACMGHPDVAIDGEDCPAPSRESVDLVYEMEANEQHSRKGLTFNDSTFQVAIRIKYQCVNFNVSDKMSSFIRVFAFSHVPERADCPQPMKRQGPSPYVQWSSSELRGSGLGITFEHEAIGAEDQRRRIRRKRGELFEFAQTKEHQ